MDNSSLEPRDSPLAVGDIAPDFTLPDQQRNEISLGSLVANGPAMLSFYPFDFTSTCTTEMECLSVDIPRFKTQGMNVVGISCDSPAAHKVFAESHNLSIPLLSDLHRHVCLAFGFYWAEMNVASRGSVLVGPDRVVMWVQARELGTPLVTDELLAQSS
jgi:mycoredoxin-dependent peroxiredoxin